MPTIKLSLCILGNLFNIFERVSGPILAAHPDVFESSVNLFSMLNPPAYKFL